MTIAVVVGHVDHGKTALVHALTGQDTDRLPEEKRRGMSIDIGCAYRRLGDGHLLALIDVPGHADYARNMLAGLTQVDVALVVVAADDGVMPQTREHVAVLDLLGVRDAVIVLTKTDRVDASRSAAVAAQVRALLADTTLAHAPLLPFVPTRGDGSRALLRALATSVAARRPSCSDPLRLARCAIDRAFTLPGIGVVVTGTLQDGALAVGDRLTLAPAGIAARVRAIHIHDQEVECARGLTRVALQLAGVAPGQVARGDWLLDAALCQPTMRVDCRVRVRPGLMWPLRHASTLQSHCGAATGPVRLLFDESRAVSPGCEAFATLDLSAPLPLFHGDRVLLRDPARQEVVAVATVLDPLPAIMSRRSSGRAARLRALDTPDVGAALFNLAQLAVAPIDIAWAMLTFRLDKARLGEELAQAGLVRLEPAHRHAAGSALLDATAGALRAWLAAHHRDHPGTAGASTRDAARRLAPHWSQAAWHSLVTHLALRADLTARGECLRLANHIAAPTSDQALLAARVLPRLRRAAHRPPRINELAARLGVTGAVLDATLARLVRDGDLLRLDSGRYLARNALPHLAATARRLAREAPDARFDAAQFRDALAVGRGLAVALLECLDRERITVRIGDKRRLGASTPVSAPPVMSRAKNHWRTHHRFASAPQ